jgi:hypothetical protein
MMDILLTIVLEKRTISHCTQKQYILNLDEKMKDDEFINDTNFLLRPAEVYNPVDAYNLIKKNFLKIYNLI